MIFLIKKVVKIVKTFSDYTTFVKHFNMVIVWQHLEKLRDIILGWLPIKAHWETDLTNHFIRGLNMKNGEEHFHSRLEGCSDC